MGHHDKVAGLPVHSLLGGKCRDRIAMYTSGVVGLKAGSKAEGIVWVKRDAQRAVDEELRGLKIARGAGSISDLASVDAVREVVGEN